MHVERPGYFGIVLSLIGDYLDDGLNRILEPLGRAIGDSSAQIDRMTAELGPIDAGIWINDEVGGIEELLGVAFVACQVHITYIASHIRMLHRHAAGRPRSARLTTTDGTRTGIMQHGFTAAAGTPYSPVEVMNAFANHYKHRD